MQTEIVYARYKGVNGEAGFTSGRVYKIIKHTYFKRRGFLDIILRRQPEVAVIHTFKAVKGVMVEARAVLSTKMSFTSEEKYQYAWREENNSYFSNLKK